jgi:dihydrosphingosine 1-phosphate phosphatase
MAAVLSDDILPFPEKKLNLISSNDLDQNLSDSSSGSTRAPSRSSSLASVMSAYEKPQQSEKDAGNKPLDHYKTRLPAWRYNARQYLLPIIRWETPRLAKLQFSMRCLPLDVFFALSANLGTHTFYAVMLPVCFWFGQFHFGLDLVFVLAFGVYLTGFLKDLLCLPRPLSPPLHRITMSGSAALEYGFPSTHTANAVSVGLLCLTKIHENQQFVSPISYILLHLANVMYVFAIVAGRIYCGMHGFLDVLVGGLIGFGLWWFRHQYGFQMDYFLATNNWVNMAYATLLVILVRTHPEPADDCPCFDDGVSFLGVELGIHGSNAYFAYHSSYKSTSCYGCLPYSYAHSGIVGTALRLAIGVVLVMAWRSTMKPLFHKHLPPLFRLIERVGLSMPRRFFTPASQYTKVPKSLSDSTFNSGELSSIFKYKGRSDSVGPQSEADVYESLAYREYQRQKIAENERTNEYKISYRGKDDRSELQPPQSSNEETSYENNDQELNQEQLMSTVVVPRVRYDVEVVTRLIVYAGISFVSLVVTPIIIEMIAI